MAPNNLSATAEEGALVVTRIFDAPRTLVFRAWSTPEHLANWFRPTGFTLPSCQVDFRVGGSYRLCMRSPEGKDYWVHGVYREIVEHAAPGDVRLHGNPRRPRARLGPGFRAAGQIP